MRAVVCRVDHAAVSVDDKIVGRIDAGLLVYVGVIEGDTEREATWLADKLLALRIFNDQAGKLNRSVVDIAGGILLIPNFTLAGRTQKGTRPSFSDAARSEIASPLFDFIARRCVLSVPTATGVFGAHMLIDARFNGPVTLVVDTP
ncbi:MAG: D-tyrosyl-tRNA(Tyr) deacylase [Planctomycetes bacterium]|nr:D-tyrosyl-tRNA(Tyr) deacylase [Planctomycetota bacterium]